MKGRRVEKVACFCRKGGPKDDADPKCPACAGTGSSGLVFVDPPTRKKPGPKPEEGRHLDGDQLMRLRERAQGRGAALRFAREADVPEDVVARLLRGQSVASEAYDAVVAVLDAEAF